MNIDYYSKIRMKSTSLIKRALVMSHTLWTKKVQITSWNPPLHGIHNMKYHIPEISLSVTLNIYYIYDLSIINQKKLLYEFSPRNHTGVQFLICNHNTFIDIRLLYNDYLVLVPTLSFERKSAKNYGITVKKYFSFKTNYYKKLKWNLIFSKNSRVPTHPPLMLKICNTFLNNPLNQ